MSNPKLIAALMAIMLLLTAGVCTLGNTDAQASTDDTEANEVDSYYYDGTNAHVVKTLDISGTISSGLEYDRIICEISTIPFSDSGHVLLTMMYGDRVISTEEYDVRASSEGRLQYNSGTGWNTAPLSTDIRPNFVPVILGLLAPGVVEAILALLGISAIAISLNELLEELDKKDKEEGNTAERTTTELPGDITIILYDGVPSIVHYDGQASNVYEFEDSILRSLETGLYYPVFKVESNNLAICPIPLDSSVAAEILRLNSPDYHTYTPLKLHASNITYLVYDTGWSYYHTPNIDCYDLYLHYHIVNAATNEVSESMSFYGLVGGAEWEPDEED